MGETTRTVSREPSDELSSKDLDQLLSAAGERGWQPLDLVHLVRRFDARLLPMLGSAMVAQARSMQAAQRAPRFWLDQLAAVAEEDRSDAAQGAPLDWTDRPRLIAVLRTVPI